MTKHLSRLGNSAALVIDKPILELLGIDLQTRIEITTDGESLTLRPVRTPSDEELKTATDWVIKKYGRALDRLGDPSSTSKSGKSSKSTRS